MQQVKCIDGGIVALSGATSSVVSAGSVLRRPAPLPAPCPAPTRSRKSLRAAPYGPGLHPFLGHVIRPCEQHPLALIRLVFEETVNHTNAKAASHAVALEGRWPPPVRAATCPVPPNRTLEGNVRPLEQPQRLGLLLVCPSLGGPCERRG